MIHTFKYLEKKTLKKNLRHFVNNFSLIQSRHCKEIHFNGFKLKLSQLEDPILVIDLFGEHCMYSECVLRTYYKTQGLSQIN